jgi:hypothetical protein
MFSSRLHRPAADLVDYSSDMNGTLSAAITEAQVADAAKSSLQRSKRCLRGEGRRSPVDQFGRPIRQRSPACFQQLNGNRPFRNRLSVDRDSRRTDDPVATSRGDSQAFLPYHSAPTSTELLESGLGMRV